MLRHHNLLNEKKVEVSSSFQWFKQDFANAGDIPKIVGRCTFMCFVSLVVFFSHSRCDSSLGKQLRFGKRSACPTMTIAKLLGELFRWLRLAFRLFASWQTPFALFAKW